MKRDIIVINPKKRRKKLDLEEENAWIEDGFFFRTFAKKPISLEIGCRIFELEDNFIIGFFEVSEIKNGKMLCGTTGTIWNGWHAILKTVSWKWIRPIPMRAFQGWRYFPEQFITNIKIIADWRGDPIN
jgi:hypothetical protein